jgi:heme-degrading monooxygenase HmoA
MFIAMSHVTCDAEYTDRFPQLATTVARELDDESGFIRAQILKPVTETGRSTYIVMSCWEKQEDFERFLDTHMVRNGPLRAFIGVNEARRAGKPLPITSETETYEVVAI